jgi:hypothetical protein
MDDKTIYTFFGIFIGAIFRWIFDSLIQKLSRDRSTFEKIDLAVAELRNASRHFERSEQNMRSYTENGRTPRKLDILKTSYSKDGFISIKMADLIGLPSYMSRDLMQLGMVYRNQELEIENTISIYLQNPNPEIADLEKFINRLQTVGKITKGILGKIEKCRNDRKNMRMYTEYEWPDSMYETGKIQPLTP